MRKARTGSMEAARPRRNDAGNGSRKHQHSNGKYVTGEISTGRTTLLLIGEDGKELASYNWKRH
jgi:hypothetical protein